MFRQNCEQEVKNFLSLKLSYSLSVNKLIGISEVRRYLQGNSSKEETIELINIKTRQYAKRQKTWSRGHMGNWNKLYSEDSSILLKKILKVIS